MTREPGGAPTEGEELLLGAVIAGRYRLIEKIGEGGTGAVYRGVHETLRKPVAVKLLGRAARADRELVTRFEREAVAAANLKHPAIAEATDFGQLPDGTLFLVMEYVEGSSLRAILVRDGRLPPPRALHLLRQVGAAAVFAHGREVVHRDLKPENVVVFDRGEERDLVKVIDFGIARMRSAFGGGPSGLTKVGSVVGTVEYMSPEQAMGQAVDARADQYALGVIAFELFTGRLPYVADDVASLVYMHVGAPIPRATERAPELPAALDDVLARMMGKLPDERFPALSEALAALAAAFEPPAPAAVLDASRAVPRAPDPAPVVTARGTLVTGLESGPQRRAAAPPAALPRHPAGAPAPRSSLLKREDLPIILVSVLVSVIGLIVVVVIFVREWGSSSDDAAAVPSASPGDGPAMMNPTSHDRGKVKPPPLPPYRPPPHGKGKHGED